MPSPFLHPFCARHLPSLLALLYLTACSDFRVPALEKLKSQDSAQSDKPESKDNKPTDDTAEAAKKKPSEPSAPGAAPSVDLSFLLSMNYDEAKSISAQSMDLPMGIRVAADSIEVLKTDRKNQPKRIRAKGKVYLESGKGQDVAKMLCQEAYINSSEIVLRGKPIIQRGGSVVEGLEDRTIAYMIGIRLRVLGLHRVTNPNTMIAMLPDLGPWSGGPNLILPPLTEDAVPSNMREDMLKAAEAEAVLQQNRADAFRQPAAPAAPWIKDEPTAKVPPAEKKPAANGEKPVQIKSA